MGFFKNLWSKAKGVLGKVWNGIKEGAKKIAPHIGNVLNTVGDFTGIKALNMAGNLFNRGKQIYDKLSGDGSMKDKIDEVKNGINDGVQIIKDRPGLNQTIDQTKDFAKREIDKYAPTVIAKPIGNFIGKLGFKGS